MEEAAAGKSQSGANRRMILTRSSRGIMFSWKQAKKLAQEHNHGRVFRTWWPALSYLVPMRISPDLPDVCQRRATDLQLIEI